MAFKPMASPGLGARLFAPGTPAETALLCAAWPLAVGADLGQRTEVIGIENGTLRVRVPDARWRKVLHRMRREILVRLRATAGPSAPYRLGFVEGPLSFVPPASAEPAPLREVPAAPSSVVGAAEAIGDPALRERFLACAARYLDRFPAR
ncbi:MAG: DciA family protein [Vicinamibacteria bacterium]